jgi:hypothetical protein
MPELKTKQYTDRLGRVVNGLRKYAPNGNNIYFNGEIETVNNKTQIIAEVMTYDPKTKECSIFQFNITGNEGLADFLDALASGGTLEKLNLKDDISGTIACYFPDLGVVNTIDLNVTTDVYLNPNVFFDNSTNKFLQNNITGGYTDGSVNVSINGNSMVQMNGSFFKNNNSITYGGNIYPSNSNNSTTIELGSFVKKRLPGSKWKDWLKENHRCTF